MMKEILTKSSRVYSVVKTELLDGTLRTGEWIDVPALAQRIGVSPTPVRYALFELAGEGLIQAHDRQGFHTFAFDDESLRDLFELRSDLFLVAASSAVAATRSPELAATAPEPEDISHAVTSFFADLAGAARRPQLRQAIERIDDRLRPVQRAKLEIVPGLKEEYRAIASAWRQRDMATLAATVKAACQLRLSLVPDILAALRRGR